MESIGFLLLLAVGWFVLKPIVSGFISGSSGLDQKHCMTCGIEGTPTKLTKGSIFIEIILWLCLLVPGLIYSIWRMTTKYNVCPHCKSTTLVPSSSPAAAAHRKQLGQDSTSSPA